MPAFFIDRPIFAWVVALFICLIGLISIPFLGIAQYPIIAPPSISISTSYPGSSPEELYNSTTRLIEEELNGASGILNFESTSDSLGQVEIIANFVPGTDSNLASVEVQNRIKRVEARLPRAVIQQGILVEEASSAVLQIITLQSTDGSLDEVGLGDFMIRNVLGEVRRIPGVGRATLYSTERSLRIWVDPVKLVGYNLTADDVTKAIQAQNAQVASGSVGSEPSRKDQSISALILVKGQLGSADEFGAIVLRANPDGSTVRLRDVARIEIGGMGYQFTTRLNGKPSAGLSVLLSPTGNALATASAVEAKMKELSKYFPANITYDIPYNITPVVEASIEKVLMTLLEAVVLVFLVMLLFLQNVRYTLIPTIVVPIALLGTCTALYMFGYSINMLTMFGMVLAIGILVDDAIVVVENVERIMSEEGLPPWQATRKAMGQISGAIVGITVVLISVFVPLAFFSGSIGNIYRQFAAVMGLSIAFSAFFALTLTPALCATLLKPVEAGHHHEKTGFFGRFNRGFARTAKGYEGWLSKLAPRAGRSMVVYAAIIAAATLVYLRLPTSFLPNEDQGTLLVNVQLPPGATQERTRGVMEQVEGFMLKQPEVQGMVGVLGFSFSGQGQNAGLAFVTLKDWSERAGAEHSAQALAQRAFGALMGVRDAFIFPLSPPPIPELGTASGFTFRLQDRAGLGREALLAARNQLLGMASKSPVLAQVRPDGLENAPQLQIDIDRDRAQALGVSFDAINTAISTALGSSYANDFPSGGRLQRVVVQADAPARMQPEDLLKLHVLNARGQSVPLGAFASTRWISGAMQTVRYNGYPAMRISGAAAPGRSTGEAMAEVEQLAAQLPAGIGYEWTGQSREEKLAGSQAMVVYACAILAVFLCLAALYESWSIPFAVILVVPLGVLGVLLASWVTGMANDVYFQIGLITIIGLSAKNAILIIEFAKDLQAQGKGVIEAALQAAHLRFRPILMTSLAFTLGVLPLALASGAGSASQRAIGTGVIGGMLSGTVLAVVFVPLFFVLVRRFVHDTERQQHVHHASADRLGMHGHEHH